MAAAPPAGTGHRGMCLCLPRRAHYTSAWAPREAPSALAVPSVLSTGREQSGGGCRAPEGLHGLDDAGGISLHLSPGACGCTVLEPGWESIISRRAWGSASTPSAVAGLQRQHGAVALENQAESLWLQAGVETPDPEAQTPCAPRGFARGLGSPATPQEHSAAVGQRCPQLSPCCSVSMWDGGGRQCTGSMQSRPCVIDNN